MLLEMKLKLLIIVLLFFLLVPSCIDPIDFSKGNDSKELVVDGLITNEPGPYTVYLTRTSAYNAFTYINESVEGAIVTISDDMGNSETLTETSIGIYKTAHDGMRGLSGREYKLEIKTSDGQQYMSRPEWLNAVPNIDSVYYEKGQQEELDDDNRLITFEGFQVYMDTRDPEDINNFYRLAWAGTHEIRTQPLKYKEGLISVPRDCCETCWVTDVPGQIDVFDDAFYDGNQITKRPVTFVRIKKDAVGRHFRGKYHVEVRQLSLSKEAYDYWLFIQNQMISAGSIFDPPPAAIVGNIKNVNEPETTVFGYFGASAVSKKSFFIPESEAPYLPSDTLIFEDDCRRFRMSTPYKPSFW